MTIARAGVTATQLGATTAQLARLADGLRWLARGGRRVAFGHGVCIGGDHDAAMLAVSLPCVVEVREFPPRITTKMARVEYPSRVTVIRETTAEYLARNRAIVAWCEVLFALPREEHGDALRSGTWSTVRHACRVGRACYVIRPNGRAERVFLKQGTL